MKRVILINNLFFFRLGIVLIVYSSIISKILDREYVKINNIDGIEKDSNQYKLTKNYSMFTQIWKSCLRKNYRQINEYEEPNPRNIELTKKEREPWQDIYNLYCVEENELFNEEFIFFNFALDFFSIKCFCK